MAKKFSDIRKPETPERRARIEAKKKEMLAEVRLQDLRRARSMSQVMLAEAMDVAQSEVSKIERRTDVYVGTIRRYLEAMGGSLRITAVFPEGEEVEISQFSDIAEPELAEA